MKAVQQEPGAGEQHHRGGDLERQQRRPEQSAASTPSRFQRLLEIYTRSVKGGRQAEQHDGCASDGNSKDKDGAIERDVVGPRNVCQRHERIDRERRQRPAQQAATSCEHHALNQQLPDQSSATGTECRPDRHFLCASRDPRQQKARKIRTCDQENARHCARENPQRTSDRRDH